MTGTVGEHDGSVDRGTALSRLADPGAMQLGRARALLDGLTAGGVGRLVISPGSRSTPLVLAAASSELQLWTVLDERSAAFFALGQSRADFLPTALICTSGSAPAHYLPALVEAREARVPLVVVSADRPSELQAGGAPQTIDQVKLFGDVVIGFFDLSLAEASARSLRATRRLGAQAAALSRGPSPGPVHVNVRARKPLAPVDSGAGGGSCRSAPTIRLAADRPAPEAADELRAMLHEARRPLVVCGPAELQRAPARDALSALIAAWRLPICAELTSQLRPLADLAADEQLAVPELSLALQSARVADELSPDLILQIGRPPVAPVWERFVESHERCRHAVIDERQVHDPVSTADWIAVGPLEELARSVAEGAVPVVRRSWIERLRATAQACRLAVEETIEQAPDAPFAGEGVIARRTVAASPPGGLLALGNSLPLRLAESFGERATDWRRVWCQRGANGIDGVVSGVAGSLSTLAATVSGCVLLLGDVALIHDLGGLALAARAATQWSIVVINNRGGRIFEQLPAHGRAAGVGAAELFTTPHEVSFAAAAAVFGICHVEVATPLELEDALGEARTRRRATLIEATVGEHAAADELGRLRWAVERRLGELDPYEARAEDAP